MFIRKTSCACLIALLALVAPAVFAADEAAEEPTIIEEIVDIVLSLVDGTDDPDEFGSTIEPN